MTIINMKNSKQLLIFFTILGLAYSSLTIYKPENVATTNKQQLGYTIANFGHIPYGKTLIGKIVASDPDDLCNITEVGEKAKDQKVPVFLLINRGNCKFTQKAINAQRSGASLAIIEDIDYSQSGRIVMKNDGFGFQVEIPSIFISRDSGQKLRRLVKESNNQLIIKIKFDTQRSDKIFFRMWLDANDRHSYVLMRDFHQYHEALQNHMTSELFFKIIDTCHYCDPSNCIITTPSKYCYIPSNNNLLSGKEVIELSLKSYFAFQEDDNKWWKFMDKFDKQCSMNRGSSACADELLEKLGYDKTKIAQKVENQKNNAIQGKENNVLQLWAEQAKKGNILFYPDVTINNVNYQGQLIASDIFQMVCNSLNKPPYQCDSFVDYQTDSGNRGTSVGAIIFYTLLVMTLGFVIVLLVFKKCVKRRMSTSIANQVNQMVSQYISFYDKNDKTTEQAM